MSNKWVYDVFFDYMILEQLYNESKKEIGEDKWKKDEEYLNVCETGFGFNTYTDKDGNTTETCDGFKALLDNAKEVNGIAINDWLGVTSEQSWEKTYKQTVKKTLSGTEYEADEYDNTVTIYIDVSNLKPKYKSKGKIFENISRVNVHATKLENGKKVVLTEEEIDELVSKLTVRFVGVAQAFYTDTYY